MKRARAKAIALKSGDDVMNKWLYMLLDIYRCRQALGSLTGSI